MAIMATPTAAVTEPILTALHYLFTHSENRTVAHCLDLDLVTSGKDLAEAEASLNALVLYQVRSCFVAGNFAQLQLKAPAEYWQALKGAKDIGSGQLEFEVPPVILPVERARVSLRVFRVEREMAAVA